MPDAAIAGYETLDADWIEKSEAIDPRKLYAFVLDLFPETLKGLKVLDVGAGAGRDAAWLARQGSEVTALEPARNLATAGQMRHRAIPIHWVEDRLPELGKLEVAASFGLILCVGVWQHLDEAEQPQSFQRICQLLKPGGRAILALRHGASADHQVNFPIDVERLLSWAQALNVNVLRCQDAQSQGEWNRANGVGWTWLVLEKPRLS